MAKTDAGKAIKFFGLSRSTRKNLLLAILGGYTDLTGSSATKSSVTINSTRNCYLGLSSVCPERAEGTGDTKEWVTDVEEPTDANYTRICIGKKESTGSGSSTSYTWSSDYMKLAEKDDGYTTEADVPVEIYNHGTQKEIKFNRVTDLAGWNGTSGEITQYKYFFLTSVGATGDVTASNLIAYGELTTPITVEAVNTVPLFAEDALCLFFPAPDEVDSTVDNMEA